MSVYRLPTGRWRAQVYDPATRTKRVSLTLGPPGTFWTRSEAVLAAERAHGYATAVSPTLTLRES